MRYSEHQENQTNRIRVRTTSVMKTYAASQTWRPARSGLSFRNRILHKQRADQSQHSTFERVIEERRTSDQ